MAENVGSIKYTVEAETDQLLRAEKVVDKSTKAVADSFVKADKATKLFQDGMKDSGRTINAQGQVIAKNGKIVFAATNKYQGLVQNLNKTSAAFAATSKVSTKASANVRGIGQSAGQAGIQVQQFVGQIQGGQDAMLALSAQSADLGFVLGAPLVGAIVGIGASIIGMASKMGTAKVDVASLSDSIGTLVDKFDDLNEAQQKALKIGLSQNIKDSKKGTDQLQIQINELQTSLIVAKTAGKGRFLESLFGDDPEKIESELAAARLALTALNLEREKLSKQAKQLGTNEKELTEQQDKNQESLSRLINASAVSALRFGGSDREVAKYTATMLGANDAQLQLIDSTFDVIDIKKADIKTEREREAALNNTSNALDRMFEKEERDDEARAARAKRGTETQAFSISGRLEDPVAKLERQKAEELAVLKKAEEDGLELHQSFSQLRGEIDAEFEQKRAEALEARFRAESEGNAFLMDSIDALGSAATTTLSGMLSGTMSLTDAMQNFAGVILSQAVGALVDVGIQQIKNALIGKTVAAANGAAYTASVTAQVGGMSALAAQNAFAATAAIPIIGPALAPAAGAAAGAAALAMGSPAIATAPVAGAREFGGSALAGKMYRMGEKNKPEILQSFNKDLHVIPGDNGKVFNQNQLDKIGGGGSVNNFNFITDPNVAVEQGPTTQNSQGGQDSEFVIRVIANDLAQHGSATNRALQSTNTVNDRLAGKRRG